MSAKAAECSRVRRALLSVSAIGLSLGLFLGLIEIVLHFLPVNEVLSSLPVNEANPVLRFVPDRTMIWSNFADFRMRNTVRSNNYGFINDQDYDRGDPRPLVAVIGDSYVEALMVPYAETLFGRLSKIFGDRARVYSFGRSGGALTQYLAYAQWCRDLFRPAKVVILVVGNDFDESLLKYKSDPGLHYFEPRADGSLALRRIDYAPGLGVQVASRSRLLMYLLTNVRILDLPARLRLCFQGQGLAERYIGQTEAAAGEERLRDSRLAADAFFDLLPKMAGLPPRDVCLVVDGMRPHLYAAEDLEAAKKSFFGVMREEFMDKARRLGFWVVDMQEAFVADFRKNGKRFEYLDDGHWNSIGHGVAAQALLDSGFLDEFLEHKSGRQGAALVRAPQPAAPFN